MVTAGAADRDLVEVTQSQAGTSSAMVALSVSDVDGTAAYDTAALQAVGWSNAGAGLWSKTGTYGVASLNTAIGTVSYALDNAPANSLGAGDVRTETVLVAVKDDLGSTASASATFTVRGANDAPTVTAGAPDRLLVEATLANAGVSSATALLTKSDVDGAASYDTTALTAGGWTSGANGTWSKASTYGVATLSTTANNVTFVLDNVAAEPLGTGDAPTQSFTIPVRDPQGATASTVVTFTVLGADDGIKLTAGAPSATLMEVGDGVTGVSSSTVALTRRQSFVVYDAAALIAGEWSNSGGGLWTKAGDYGVATLNTATDRLTYALNNALADSLTGDELVQETFTVPASDGGRTKPRSMSPSRWCGQ